MLQEMYQKTGAPIHSAYALPQLLDIYADNNPRYEKIRETVHKWQTIASICLGRWTGEPFLPISFSEASWTGLLNFRTCHYEESAMNILPEACRKTMPTLADFSDATSSNLKILAKTKIDGNDNPYWDRWPELRGASESSIEGCRLFLGLGDGACANIGSKCSTSSRIAVTVGTSAAARICLPLPVRRSHDSPNAADIEVPKGLFCYRINRAHVILGGALTDGGSVIEWISNLLKLSSTEAFNECLSNVQSLSEKDYNSSEDSPVTGLTVVPFLSGERSTGFRDGATGAFLGLTRETTPAHVLKGCLEGVTLRLNAVVKLIRRAVEEMQGKDQSLCLVASGKALEVNSFWRQLLSDCSGLKVIMDGETQEGTSRGVARAVAVALSATATSQGDDISALYFSDEAIKVSKQSNPNTAAKHYWVSAEDSQELLLETLSPLFY
jgi:gluconokinase